MTKIALKQWGSGLHSIHFSENSMEIRKENTKSPEIYAMSEGRSWEFYQINCIHCDTYWNILLLDSTINLNLSTDFKMFMSNIFQNLDIVLPPSMAESVRWYICLSLSSSTTGGGLVSMTSGGCVTGSTPQ